ncbi:hypothetical protein Desor_0837 [Desulfosporosinus orientis DSM 765]|uniref:DUF362 domain-containing protein n=1 Tax=Desulfosporosinus orientis (strain ATCC 19365 / DSM 765 / NCIMB 8382 / VKM B-1628 / Singapore I) TaxID=768706 RepID=G7WAG9_DESOD|nr:DUF362 domain-containing protein [Desulfosporosinus orientis]AET66518.1 hypothetical protein Desor_0837 [Desulfosporosinus orientis DSM 765]
MVKAPVSLIKVADVYEAVQESLKLCDGLSGLKVNDRILIKPNIVSWDFKLPFPPYGVVTTSVVINALVRILAENGFKDLTIGEGALPNVKAKGTAVYEALGYKTLQERYGVKLVDFNTEKFVAVEYEDGFKLDIAHHALEADKIINVPVLKTHSQAKVSLGIKNLKGCLNKKSKQACHGLGDQDLPFTFPRIIEKLPVALTIIDGLYTLEKGPGPTGKAYRKDLIIASRDPFACDLVGAAILGYSAKEVEHLKYYAKRHGYSLELADYEVRGEKVLEQQEYTIYDWGWTEDDTGPVGFKKRGITGIAIRKYDNSLCTGCSVQFNPMLILLGSAYRGQPFPNVELVSGKQQLASPGFDRSVLFGKCACHNNRNNPNIKKALFLWGCPPDLGMISEQLAKEGIQCDYQEYIRFRNYLFDRYKAVEGFELADWTVE